MLLVVGGNTGSRGSTGFEVQRGIREGERLTGKVAEVRFLEGLRASDGVASSVGLVVARGGDEEEAMFGIGAIRLEPALSNVTGMLMGWVTGPFAGGEASGDGRTAVEDLEVDFGLREVSVGATGGGVKDGSVVLWFAKRAVGAKEGGGCGGQIAEAGWVDDGGDAVPLFVFGHEDGANQVLVELNGEDCVQFTGSSESKQIEPY